MMTSAKLRYAMSEISSLRHGAQEGVRHLLASGADEADIAEYVASLGSEPEDEIAPPEGEPALRTAGMIAIRPPLPRRVAPAVQRSRPVRSGQRKFQPATPSDRITRRPRAELAQEGHEGPPGVQGANTGYWQAGGVTRAGAKRSKRP